MLLFRKTDEIEKSLVRLSKGEKKIVLIPIIK